MPADPSVVSAWEISTHYRYRRSLLGKLILQVEESRKIGRATPGGFVWTSQTTRWRDARLRDYSQGRALIFMGVV